MQTPSSIDGPLPADFFYYGYVFWRAKPPSGAVGEIVLAVCLGTVSIIALFSVLTVMAYAGIQAIL